MLVGWSLRGSLLCAVVVALLSSGCDTPSTTVIVENAYAPADAFVIFRAFWLATSFPTPIAPGDSSDPQDTFAASANSAYVVVARGWDPAAAATPPPATLLVLQSRQGFELHWDTTLHIPVDDTTFAGNCAAASFLTQEQADFITQRVFVADFAGLAYDAATCTTTGAP
jgi:hypothetical protein